MVFSLTCPGGVHPPAGHQDVGTQGVGGPEVDTPHPMPEAQLWAHLWSHQNIESVTGTCYQGRYTLATRAYCVNKYRVLISMEIL